VAEPPSYDHIRTIPGWMNSVDFRLFQFILGEQNRRQLVGDVAELGVYRGKSAAVIGGYVKQSETFTVVDLFRDDTGADAANAAEQAREYGGLQRNQFERHYLSVHDELPVVVEGLSHTIIDHAAAGAHRFVHIDASHLFPHVRRDIEVARGLLLADGVVVLDDIRSEHTPGVAAAGWQAVAAGMNPIAISGMKLYATWGNTEQWRTALSTWLPTSALSYESQEVSGRSLFRVWGPPHPVKHLSGLARRAVAAGLTGVSKARIRSRTVMQRVR
jgi:hypothetical protein